MPTSTRHRILDQIKFAIGNLATARHHMMMIVKIADGNSDYIIDNIQLVVDAIDNLEEVFKAFRSRL